LGSIMVNSLDAVIFDMDGTLVDTMRMTSLAFQICCGFYDLPVPPMEAVKALIGFADAQFYRMLYPEADEMVLRALSVAIEIEEASVARRLGEDVLFPGVLPMINTLYDAGIPLYLASTGSHHHVNTSLAAFGGARFFQQINCGEPDKIDMTARIVRQAGKACVFVGDTIKDVEAAHANNLFLYGAGFGYVKPDEKHLFDRIYDTPEALTQALLATHRKSKVM
jgi:phosphoglycolate phosphatase-like HAD superfamily hydrolase